MPEMCELDELIAAHRSAIAALKSANVAERVFGRQPYAVPDLRDLFVKNQRMADTQIRKLSEICAKAPGDWTATLQLATMSTSMSVSLRLKLARRGLI